MLARKKNPGVPFRCRSRVLDTCNFFVPLYNWTAPPGPQNHWRFMTPSSSKSQWFTYPHCLMTRHSWYLIQEPLVSPYTSSFPIWQWLMKPRRTSTRQQNLQVSLTWCFLSKILIFSTVRIKFWYSNFSLSLRHFYCHMPIYQANWSNHLILKFQDFLSVLFKLLAGQWNHFLQLLFQHQLTAAHSSQFCLQSLNLLLKTKGSHVISTSPIFRSHFCFGYNACSSSKYETRC